MTLSLPADPTHALRLTEVLQHAIAATTGEQSSFAPARSAIVMVVDGLGASALSAHAGYARFLAGLQTKRGVAVSTFPSTTATALTSLLTGADAGAHGMVGYRALDPQTSVLHNQLTDWGPNALDPLSWQRARPLFSNDGEFFVVSKPEYASTGFTEATTRGATFLGEKDLGARIELAAHLASTTEGSVVYLYVPELDSAGHRYGMDSDAWRGALESIDAAARRLGLAAGPGVGIIVTADHGMVDVPAHRHVLLDDDDVLVADAAAIAGEPRMLHLYAHPGRASDLRAAWEAEQRRAWVFSRDEAIDAGLFGIVDENVRPRIGDVLVAARTQIAYYDARLSDRGAERMIGQHGSLTSDERLVPLLRFGAFAL